jgi:hypothetical protein
MSTVLESHFIVVYIYICYVCIPTQKLFVIGKHKRRINYFALKFEIWVHTYMPFSFIYQYEVYRDIITTTRSTTTTNCYYSIPLSGF